MYNDPLEHILGGLHNPAAVAAYYVGRKLQMGLANSDPHQSIIDACLDGPSVRALSLMNSQIYWADPREVPRVSLFARVLKSGNLSIRWQPYGCDFNDRYGSSPSLRNNPESGWHANPIIGAEIAERPDNEFFFIRDFARTLQKVDGEIPISPKERELLNIEFQGLQALLQDLTEKVTWFAQPVWEELLEIEWDQQDNPIVENGKRNVTEVFFATRDILDGAFYEGKLDWALECLQIDQFTFLEILVEHDLLDPARPHRSFEQISKAVKEITGFGGPAKVEAAIHALRHLEKIPDTWASCQTQMKDHPWDSDRQIALTYAY